MNSKQSSSLLALALALCGLPGCLLSRGEAPEVRFYEPPPLVLAEQRELDESLPPLQLARVSAAAAVGRPMTWRRSEVELVFDEAHRWVSDPAAMVEDALRARLFVHGPYRALEGRGAARLEVRVARLEGMLGGSPGARIELLAALALPDAPATRTRRFEAEVALREASPAALAIGIGVALDAVTAEVREWVDRGLGG